MEKIHLATNYDLAKAEADRVDEQIIEVLKSGHSFIVEAGAGSGKTYSLNKVIEWIQKNNWVEYKRKKQNVACITYTNAAVNVINERLSEDSFIVPSTIHSFAWNAIKQYQEFLISVVKNELNYKADKSDSSEIVEVSYTLGHRYVEKGVQYLYHNDVLNLFCELLDKEKFRRVFSSKYPLILIDEYQDSYGPIIRQFIDHFISENKGPQFGFFGDAWQTIYQSNKACGEIHHYNLQLIKKGSNFRSAPRIVKLLNDLRPKLPQKSAIDDFQGEVLVITCDDYVGVRRQDRNFQGDLPSDELKQRIDTVSKIIRQDTAPDNLKILMITHKVLAEQQGYSELLKVLDDKLKNVEDIFLLFFMNTVEPIFEALDTSNMQLLFDSLGLKRYPITKKSEKSQWKILHENLRQARGKRAIDVLDIVTQSELIPIPPEVVSWYSIYKKQPDKIYYSGSSISELLDLNYTQFTAAIDFLFPESIYSTEHGVKGEEYDNVLFVISKGWNQYQFEKYAPMITGRASASGVKQESYERNRNLFYVCCSRAKKRLIFFVSLEIDPGFRLFLNDLVGEENVITYEQFISRSKLSTL